MAVDNNESKRILEWMKTLYDIARKGDFEWKEVHPNNMIGNGVSGYYTEFNIEKDEGFEYVKYTIEFRYRTDEQCISHPEEGIKYYLTYEFIERDIEEPFTIPEPTENTDFDDREALSVNDYGRMFQIYEDIETAKRSISYMFLHRIYPLGFMLKDEDVEEWNKYVRENPFKTKNDI